MADEKEKKQEVGYIKPRNISEEMSESYLDYAMSVIIARALPDVRDGLKPVHRRILYAMHSLGLVHTSKYRKSATVVGEVLGKYHPHGDIAVYDSMVRMAQDFAMRYPLISGQGNFGSMDGDAAAAMRYTEVKMSSITSRMLVDIEKDTVDFAPNYDGTQKEPKVLPAKIPNLLINGTMGIAVGMATNIPPHNLNEVLDATIFLIDNPKVTIEDLIKYIPGPDFPTGGAVYNIAEIKNAYATGKGKITMRAKANIEEDKKGYKIIISELPYQVNKAQLVEKIAELVKNKKIQGVFDLRDESGREGVRIVLDLKKDSYPKKILNQLYKRTAMQSVFYVNMLALVDGIQPRVLTLKMILQNFITHRQEVVERRCKFDLEKAQLRAHILKGLKIALANLDKVISIIKRSKNREEAHKNLMKKFKLSGIQTDAILDMRLHQLARLEREKIEEEYKEKLKLIRELKDILVKPKRILKIIKEEFQEIKDKYGDERKTKIYKQEAGQFAEEDLIPNEEVIVMATKGNYIKRLPISTYRAQRRGGKGVLGISTKVEDTVEHLVATFTHDNILFFTNQGRVFQLKVYDIPSGSRVSKGQAIVNILQIGPDETITGIITLEAFKKRKYLIMATRGGMIKKTSMTEYNNVRKSGLIAIRLNKDDELCWVKPTFGQDEIILATSLGQAIRFSEKDIRPMGRGTMGVRGIKLKPKDQVVGMGIILASVGLTKKSNKRRRADLLVVSENGFGKKTDIKNYHLQNRGGIGIKTAKVTEKTGKLIGIRIIEKGNYDLIIISKTGQVIRMSIESVSKLGRATQGVRLMRLKKGDKVVSITCIEKNGEEEIKEDKKGEKKDIEQKKTIVEKEVITIKASTTACASADKSEGKKAPVDKQKTKSKKVVAKKVKKLQLPKRPSQKKKVEKVTTKPKAKKAKKKLQLQERKVKQKRREKKVKKIVKKPKLKKIKKVKFKSKKPSKISSKKQSKSKKKGRKKIFT